MSDENKSLRLSRIFDLASLDLDVATKLNSYSEDLKEEIHKNLMNLIEIGLKQRILNDRSIETIEKILKEVYSEKTNFHREGKRESIEKFRSFLLTDSNLNYCITSNFAFCFMSLSTAFSCANSSPFYEVFDEILYWYHLYLKSYGSLTEKIRNGIAIAKSKDNLDKQHRKNRAAKEMILQIWDSGNPENGRAWRKYSDCAKYAVDKLGIEYEKNTIERWLSRHCSRKTQSKITKK